MAKTDFLEKVEDGMYLVCGKWYNECHYDHLIEETISGEHLLMEYYRQISEPEDEILDGYEVWVYGADRDEFTPHLHIMKGDRGSEFNVEVHLLDFEAFRMKKPRPQRITWVNLPKELHDKFMEWLMATPKKGHFQTNAELVFDDWDGNNPTNTLQHFVEKRNLQDKVHPILKEYLYGKPILIEDLISSIFDIVLPLYQRDKEARETLHRIIDPIEFAKTVRLPFEFNDYNVTPKIKKVITQYEKMCYEMTKNI